ncbi:MAG: hypothetical protein K2K64_10150 [Muribaculaceae bacterium]|nr:hypothetical protein [Muribaculaceae bacterium]
MTILGLSKYTVTDHNGVVQVRNKRTGHLLKLTGHMSNPHYTLMVDSDEPMLKCFSQGFLKFLMKHPKIDAKVISPVNDRIRFTSDGEIIDLFDKKDRKKPYNSFSDIDDALSTILVMKAVSTGDMNFVCRFIMENRAKAVEKIAKLEYTSVDKVDLHLAEGEELFISQLRTASCQRILPLFSWLCKCIRTAYLEHKRIVTHISNIKGI